MADTMKQTREGDVSSLCRENLSALDLLSPEISFEPLSCQSGYLLQGAGFFEKVRCTRNDHQLFFGFELIVGLLIQLDHDVIETPND